MTGGLAALSLCHHPRLGLLLLLQLLLLLLLVISKISIMPGRLSGIGQRWASSSR